MAPNSRIMVSVERMGVVTAIGSGVPRRSSAVRRTRPLMTVRRAAPHDAPDIIRLLSELYRSMGFGEASNDWYKSAEDIIYSRTPSHECAIFVAEEDDTIVACGGATISMRLPGPASPDGRFAYIQWMVTDPRRRRRGHAREVFQAILAWTQSEGVDNLELHATPEAEPLYRSYGFEDPRYPQLRLRLSDHT
jgi:GNAT superfamily N-acetyltransferase